MFRESKLFSQIPRLIIISSIMLLFFSASYDNPQYVYAINVDEHYMKSKAQELDALPICVYHHLLLLYPSVDVRYVEDGSVKSFAGTMSGEMMSTITSAFIDFTYLTGELSYGAVLSTYTIILVPHPLTRLSYDSVLGYWPSPEDVREDLENYAPYGTYDSVFVVWYNGPIRLPYFGLGGIFINNGSTIYSVVTSHEEWVWRAGGRPGEVFLHEWLHGVARFFSSLGYIMPEGDADGAEIHGYVWTHEEGWTRYYRDLMQGRVWEPKIKAYTGITREMWSKHCSPNIERLRTYGDLIVRYNELVTRLNELQREYDDLERRYDELKARHYELVISYNETLTKFDELLKMFEDLSNRFSSLKKRYDELSRDYDILMGKYSSLMNDYAKLEENYTNLNKEYESLKLEHLILEESFKSLNEKYSSTMSELDFYKRLVFSLSGILIAAIIAIVSLLAVKKVKTS